MSYPTQLPKANTPYKRRPVYTVHIGDYIHTLSTVGTKWAKEGRVKEITSNFTTITLRLGGEEGSQYVTLPRGENVLIDIFASEDINSSYK